MLCSAGQRHRNNLIYILCCLFPVIKSAQKITALIYADYFIFHIIYYYLLLLFIIIIIILTLNNFTHVQKILVHAASCYVNPRSMSKPDIKQFE